MDDIRKGEIALAFLKRKLRKEGCRLTPNLRRQVGTTAAELGINIEEAMEFAELLVRELVEEAFAPNRD